MLNKLTSTAHFIAICTDCYLKLTITTSFTIIDVNVNVGIVFDFLGHIMC